MSGFKLTTKQFFILEIAVILGFCFFPAFFSLPFRDNLYLSWEGAYRLSIGQVPYKDFGMPLGFGYFIIPALFFKLIGPYLYSLLYAQIAINLITLFAFRSILKILGVESPVRFFSILVFCLSYSFIYFWPWYNNSAFFYELIAVLFILLYIFRSNGLRSWAYIFLAAFFTFLSFFTKQDYGGMAFLFCLFLLLFNIFTDRGTLKYLAAYLGFLGIIGLVIILPFVKYEFGYWFNYGQPPHQSRLHLFTFLNEIIGGANWEKLYLLIVAMVLIAKIKNLKEYLHDKQAAFLAIVAIGMILQTLITKVTSRLPSDTTTYFHGFAFAFILSNINLKERMAKGIPFAITFVLIMFWWSGMYWKYATRFLKTAPALTKTSDKINTPAKQEVWKLSGLKTFNKVYLPASTVEGMKKIISHPDLKGRSDLKVLNMSELTPLAYEMNFTPGIRLPLWYHLNIGMFDKQVQEVNQRIQNNEFDLVLFEEIPNLDNFYPEQTREVLKKNYKLEDRFSAPRKDTISFIEVYLKK